MGDFLHLWPLTLRRLPQQPRRVRHFHTTIVIAAMATELDMVMDRTEGPGALRLLPYIRRRNCRTRSTHLLTPTLTLSAQAVVAVVVAAVVAVADPRHSAP